MYGPTNFHDLPFLNRGKPAKNRRRPVTPRLLAEGTDYDHPPTEIEIAATQEDLEKPRHQISKYFFNNGIVSEFLLKGLERDHDGRLRMPEKGCVKREEVDAISQCCSPIETQAPHASAPSNRRRGIFSDFLM